MTAAPGAGTPPRTRGGSRFHTLRVAEREQLTDDAVALTFDVPDELRETYTYTAGQHVTLRRELDGHEVRRTYSVCAPATSGRLRVAVKRLAGGAFSTYANDVLATGDTLDVMPPSGRFSPRLDPARARHYAALAAGSGITPVLSIVATVLAVEPASRVTLVLGNRTARDVMFAEELQDLRDRYLGRFDLHHVLSGEARESELLTGRLDAERLGRVLDVLLPPESVDEWYLCGPEGLTDVAREVLAARGVEETTVHRELFVAAGVTVAAVGGRASGTSAPASASATTPATARLDGRTSQLGIAEGETVLEALLRVRADAPYACRGGVCGTCRARVVEGRAAMRANYALEADETAAGYVLTCQAEPRTPALAVDYDA